MTERHLSREDIIKCRRQADRQVEKIFREHRRKKMHYPGVDFRPKRGDVPRPISVQPYPTMMEEAMKKKLVERMADELSWWDLIKVAFWRMMR